MTDFAIDAAAPVDDGKAKRNALVLAVAGAFGGAVPPLIFATAPLAAYEMLGEGGALATLPITAFVVGTACGTVPAALLMRRIGRRGGFLTGCAISASGSLCCALAMFAQAFVLLCLGTFLTGFAAAFVQQYRFAAADTASPKFRPRAISWVLAGGVAAAIIGPQTVIHFADLFAPAPYAGAYVGAAIFSTAAAVMLAFLDIPRPQVTLAAERGRPLGEIALRPNFLIAVGCATSAYALMSFVMTAAPLAMVMHDHHRDQAVLGIQWHALAMFGPSFVTGSLIARFGAERIVATGLLLLIGCGLVALSGLSVGHFWLALILLGIGWNFGFIGGTEMLARTYRPAEKEKVQALNDFLIFGVVALASFSSGGILLLGGWDTVNIIVLPVASASLAALFWQMRRQARTA